MSVHYKFKAALDFSTVTFDGIHISVSELKKSIIDQKRLGKNADFDLQIINAQTKEVYSDENALIPKNTSVIVARVPVTDRKKSGPPPSMKENTSGRGMHHKAAFHQQSGAEVAKGSDLSSMDLTEEEKIKAMMTQSTADYDPSHYVRIRGANQHGRVPDNYRCNKCNQGGHWISRCPNVPVVQPDVKKSTGIPRSFMVVVDSPDFPGALMTPEGRYAVPAVDHAAYLEKNKGQQTAEQPVKPKIPDDLVCPLCNDLLTDALLVPCCANSYCDDCIRSYLLESDHECPGCHEKDISPTSLIPNRFLRGTVNAFKSDTGYSKPEKVPERPQKSPPKPDHPKVDESRKLSLDELPDDLFPHSPKKIDSETEGNNNTDPESTKDLYDFNDGSIPSPFASPKRNETKVEPVPTEQRAIQSLSRSFQGAPPPGMMRGPPGGVQPPHHAPHHMIRKPLPPPSASTVEPPPPGFDILPPGEDGLHRPPSHGSNGGPQGPGNIGHDNMQRDSAPPSSGPGPNRGPPQQQQQSGQQPMMSIPPNVPPPSFNPMQPPPGYPGGPPPGYGAPQGPPPPGGPPGLPPPGFGPPGPSQNMPPYPNSYNRPPLHHMGRGPPPGHLGGPPPHHHMDHDDYGHRGRGRRPYGHGGPPHRMDEPHRDREDERPGIIDDPLKEFERLMREKDRKKKMAQVSGVRKRSKSRSFSPVPRRISPYPPKRSRSRSFSRSPSPKRKRPPPVPKRRRSYSRSPSRSPRPLRRVGKSRSRSRNRSISPPPPGNIRRSPRRAPPQYSPSPPSRFVRKEKEEYFDSRNRDRFDDRPGRFSKPPFTGRDYESKYDGSTSNKYDSSMPPKHDNLATHKSENQRPPIRPYHSHTPHGIDHELHPPFYRDKPAPVDKKPFQDFDPNVPPPGTDNIAGVPSLLDINVSHPNSNIYPISTIGTGIHQEHRPITQDFEKSRREHAEVKTTALERKKSTAEEEHEQDSDKDHRHRKSPVGKKHKKEKRKHKKKSKDEKKPKKRKTSKDERPTDGDKSSDEDAEAESVHEAVLPIPVLDNKTVGKSLADPASGETVLPDNAFAARQTAPCDSTVKSPDRSHDAELLTQPKLEQPAYFDKPQSAVDPKRRESLSNIPLQHPKDLMIGNPVIPEELRLPTSKWDEYEDYLISGESSKTATTDRDIPLATTDCKLDPGERIVTPDVIKRAESLIFDKPVKPLTESKPNPDLKDHVTEIEESTLKNPKSTTDVPSTSSVVLTQKVDTKSSSTVASTVYRKSAKDRLGSKITEDEAVLNVNKSTELPLSVKSKVSAVGEPADTSRRRRSRSRSPYSTNRYRNRSRSRSLDRLINRSRPPTEPQLNRLPDREPKSPRRRERRRTNSRERRRSVSRGRRNPEPRDKRSPLLKDRKRSPSRERTRRSVSRDRKRSPSRDRGKRASSRDRRRPLSRDRERDRRRSISRSRRRSRSRSRDRRRSISRRRGRSRSIQRSPRDRRRTLSRDREQKFKRHIEPNSNKEEVDFADKRRLMAPDKRKDAFSRSNETSSIIDQNPSPEARVFQQAGGDLSASREDQVFSPTLKKQKGRINIKLSSISKTEPQQSGSSSSDEDHEHPGDSKLSDSEKRVIREAPSTTTASSKSKSKNAKNSTRPVIQSTVSVVNGPIASTAKDKENNSKTEDGVPGEDGKRKKKRTHSPTSTKSSSSSDTKRKKKKKDKKKKKKKKKSKE